MLATPIGYLHGSLYRSFNIMVKGNSRYIVGVNTIVLVVETIYLSALVIFNAL